MTYLQWNNEIASHFFNADKAGKEVSLYISKKDIMQIGINANPNIDAWSDFVNSIKKGLPGSSHNSSIVEKAVHSFNQWKRNVVAIETIPVNYPCYIGYLAFFILPLTDENFEFRANNYYGPLNAFLAQNGVLQTIDSLQPLEDLWYDLEKWTILDKNGNVGYFALGKFSNNYRYAGKPFSQCVFPPYANRRLPLLFERCEMIPDSAYTAEQIKDIVVKYGATVLGLKSGVVDVVRKYETNEIGKSIIEIVQTGYKHWNGESFLVSTINESNVRRDHTYSRLYLQLKKNDNNGTISFSYRLRSTNAFPEDLKLSFLTDPSFPPFENVHERGMWSRTLQLPFKEKLELTDRDNKWIGRFPERNIRIFINGAAYEFNTNYWIETDSLIKTEWMYLLCKDDVKDVILKWGAHFHDGNFTSVELEGLPATYSLFKFISPKESHPNIPVLRFATNKEIRLLNALQVNHRTFTNDYLPETEIINADGTESPYLQYKDDSTTTFLNKKENSGNKWLLPKDIILQRDFNIKIDKAPSLDFQRSFTIVTANGSSVKADGKLLPKRDIYGKATTADLSQYCKGSSIVNPDKRSLRYYSPGELKYLSINKELPQTIHTPEYVHHEGNILLSFLTIKNIAKAQDFYSVFEFLHTKKFEINDENTFDYTKIRKAALNFFDYLGYLDYEYDTGDIVINPPQLIYIPASAGRRVLLIGARDEEFVHMVLKTALLYRLQVQITPQLPENQHLLLPDAITIKAFSYDKDAYGEQSLSKFARDLNIQFSQRDFTHLGLQHYSASLEQYRINMLSGNKVHENLDWPPYVFNPETLNLEKSGTREFNKNYVLTEYRVRPWEYYHRLWIDKDTCYSVDKNWGRYLVLNQLKKNVILFDKSTEKVAIPYQLPLPRLLAESIMTLSGLAPALRTIEGKRYRVYENIPGMFTENLFNKLGQNPQQKHL